MHIVMHVNIIKNWKHTLFIITNSVNYYNFQYITGTYVAINFLNSYKQIHWLMLTI